MITILLIVIFFIMLLSATIKFTGPDEKAVVKRMGKYRYTAEPKTMFFAIPSIDKVERVDLELYDAYIKSLKDSYE